MAQTEKLYMRGFNGANGEILEEYLAAGWTIKQIVPLPVAAPSTSGSASFCGMALIHLVRADAGTAAP